MTNPNFNNNAFGQFGPATTDNVALNFGADINVAENAFETQEFTVLPEGDYKFTVKDFKLSDYSGSAKLPPCKCYTINMIVDGGDAGIGYCKYNIYLVSSNAKRIRDFLVSVGKLSADTHNFNLSPALLDVSGLTGRAHFATREYSGKEYQDFKYALAMLDNNQQALPF